MACSVTITSVIGIPMGGGSTTSTIHVTGTLSGDCQPVTSPWAPIKYDIVVVVDCGSGPVSATTLSSGGSWAVDVAAKCACTKDITVTAQCASNAACKDTFTGVLQCQQADCPTGTISVSPGDCNADGTRNVTLTATITGGPTPPVVGQWIFQSGVFGPGINVSGYPTTVSQVHAYAPPGPGPGDPAEIVWLLPSNCPPIEAVISNLQSCSIVCPTNVQVQVTASAPGDCTANNTRLVTFSALVSGATPQYYNWDFPGGTPSHVDGLGAPPSQTVEYPAPGNPTASCTVTLLNGACAYTGMTTVAISACGGGGGGGNGGNGGSSLCAGILISAITLLLLGGLSIIVGICAGVAPLVIAGGIAAGIGLLLFVLWALLCARFTSCSVMQTLQCILFVVIAVIAPILAVLAFLFGSLGCVLAVAAAWGGWGTVYAWLGVAMGQAGCQKLC
jgi:hypothetical protein